MNASDQEFTPRTLADAVRAYLAQSAKDDGDTWTLQERRDDMRSALAAHDAAAAECGIPALFKAIDAAQGGLPESVQDAWDYLHLENVPRCFGGDA